MIPENKLIINFNLQKIVHDQRMGEFGIHGVKAGMERGGGRIGKNILLSFLIPQILSLKLNEKKS